jgi:hypothetical protein
MVTVGGEATSGAAAARAFTLSLKIFCVVEGSSMERGDEGPGEATKGGLLLIRRAALAWNAAKASMSEAAAMAILNLFCSVKCDQTKGVRIHVQRMTVKTMMLRKRDDVVVGGRSGGVVCFAASF